LTNQKDCPKQDWQSLGIEHLLIDIEDNPFEDILICLDGVCAWIDHALKRPDAKVLVHCVQGISRSGSICVAYLMRRFSLSYDAALTVARGERPGIDPNPGFAEQLRLWQQLEYRVFTRDDDIQMKEGYEKWRDNQGILLTKSQREKRDKLISTMIDLVRRLGSS
jgi:dual specificity phosphatase 12